MWKATAGAQINLKSAQETDPEDDWETDPDFINDVTEQEQRWGSKTIEGSGRSVGAIDMNKLRKETEEADAKHKKKQLEEGPNPSFGYGGKFGVEADRMDKSAVGHDYVPKLEKHVSQTDYSTGFGGKFGIQTDRIDKSAVSWDHKEKIDKHSSQKDYASGFGGKFGIQSDRQDQSAVGWDHIEKLKKHESQKDYNVGFGGKYGVQSDRQDKCAVGWDHHEAPQKHESQTDHKIGFGGKFGIQTDRMDKSASSFSEQPEKVGTVYTKATPDISGANPSAVRAKFENMTSEEKQNGKNSMKPAVRQLEQAKTAMFKQTAVIAEPTKPSEYIPKQLDQSKTELFTNQHSTGVGSFESDDSGTPERRKLDQSKITAFTEQRNELTTVKSQPKQLDQTKMAMFNSKTATINEDNKSDNQIQRELESLRQQQLQKRTEDTLISSTSHLETIKTVEVIESTENAAIVAEDDESEVILEDTGLTAIALYDYQAAADDEISFDPDDVITHVEMIDEGWWRGLCRNQYGLFPANYVQLQQ